MDIKRPGVTRRRRERDSVKHLGKKSAVAAGSLPSITAAAVILLNTGDTSQRCAALKESRRPRLAGSATVRHDAHQH